MNGMPRHWRVAGSYFEACNCDAVCPCRRVGKRRGGRSTYETCDFALSWRVLEGHADELELAGLSVALAGSYSDDEPGSPWRVVLYVEEDANPDQRGALAAIFLGRAGGTTFENFGRLIGEVYAVRPARIALEHGKRVFLHRRLVLREEWARRYESHPGVTVVNDATEILDVLDRLAGMSELAPA